MLMKFSGTALKNLFSKPATVAYPFAPAEFKERTRGHVEYDQSLCIFCTLCAMKCPTGAITVDRAGKVWAIDRFDCIQCGNCVNNCAKKALKIVPGYQEPMGIKTAELYKKPEEEKAASADAKPHQDPEKCVYCTLCAKKCPQEALAVDRAEKTWKLDESKCVSCGTCADACPKKAIEMK